MTKLCGRLWTFGRKRVEDCLCLTPTLSEVSVGEGNESRTYSHDEVQRLLQGQQREAGRVDTSVGSGAPDNGVTAQSIQGVLERKSSPSDMKSMLDKALDQLSN